MTPPGDIVAPVAPSDGSEVDTLRRQLEEYERWRRTMDQHIRVLEEERRRFSALAHHGDLGLVVVGADGRVSWTNAGYRERFDRQPDEARDPVGLACHRVVCHKSSPCSDCPAVRLVRTRAVAYHEMTLVAGGRFHHVYVSGFPVFSPDGSVEEGLLVLQDLTDLRVLRRSEEAVRSTEQRFRSIFEQAGAGLLTIRVDGSLIQVNPSFCTLLGYTEAELLHRNLLDVIHPDEREQLRWRLDEAAQGRLRVMEKELRLARRDGTTVWCAVTSVWHADPQGKPSYSILLAQDVTERKEAERALEQSRRRFEALVHSIDGIVWEADPRGMRFGFVSQQAERILGFPVERWLAQPRFWRNRIAPEDLEHVLEALARVVNEKRGHEFEYRMIASDGRPVWVRDTVSVVLEDGKVTKLRGLMVDVTERKAAEEALRHSEEQLRQAQKMEAIGRLAGGVAHDFNNLLTAITGYGDFLLNKLEPGSPLRRDAEEIAKAAARAALLTGQLLAFSRQQVMQPKVLDLNAVVRDMEEMLRRLIGEDVTLTTRCGSRLGAVRADPGQLQQVILNLVVNSRDAMPRGGEIVLETADVDLTEEYAARHAVVEPGSYALLAVTDNGCGMDEQTKAHLFEPFFTTKRQGQGTGLGLSTVYGIVKQSGGHIWVYSEIGEGTTFKIYLPRVAGRPEAALRRERLPDLAPGTERVLLVEDDDSVRELAREILEMNGYTVFEARDGVEALAFCEAGEEPIDLMVTDLVMPRMGGRELADRVAPLRPALRVLFLSGYTDSAVMQQGMLEPGSFFLQKPFSPAVLAHKVREALDS